MTQKLYIKIAAMLAVITLLGVGITALTAPRADERQALRVVTSFYPVYIAAQNVAGGIDGVEVVNMVDGQFGCLHDYQMSPLDRVVLESADVFVMNGAGAEPFLDAVLRQVSLPSVIDLSQHIDLLESGHVHRHDGEEHHHDGEDEMTANDHVWMSPMRYRQQIETLRDGLMAADPARAQMYAQNAAAYLRQIEDVETRLRQAAQPFAQMKTVLFHDSLAYLAEDLDLHVATALNVGEDNQVSAATLSQAEDALVGEEAALFLYDSQYETVGYTYLQELPTVSFATAVDTAVTGDGKADAWLRAMTALCETWEAATIK